jgi:2-polyprenyl-3-methyl-5-hydroxy-6-metoxy-1,4-benzoquinol methylase
MSKKHATLEEMRRYWEARAPSYTTDDVFGRNIIRAWLDKVKPTSLIEIGCGHGELFSLYKDIPTVTAIDWSDAMLQRANLRKARHYLPNLHIQKHDICQCSPRGHYDVAVTRTVLMHIPPGEIEKAVRHIVKIADVFLHLEYWEAVVLNPLAAHCFLHDYVDLFEKQECELVTAYTRPDMPQILFHFRKKTQAKTS